MSSVRYRPDIPIEIALTFDSPQAVAYSLFQKPPGGSYTLFARGTDEEGVQVSGHQHVFGPVLVGTMVRYRLIFGGNPGSAIKAQVTFRQTGVALKDATFQESGTCDQDGVAVRSKEITFDA